jgi:hypothetical protein
MPMVSYQTYTAIAFDIAKDKGAQFDGIEDGGDFISDIAEYWSAETQALTQMTEAQVRADIRPLIQP